jgi:glycosyltransferase involved in cell wall biosynthesis
MFVENSSQPLVSVIIIFLDAARFIEEAIESVLAQTYRNWELLLVHDGSTDDSTHCGVCLRPCM